MAFFIPVDLFGSYTDGYEIGRKSVWDDRTQAEKVTEARIKNIHDADTLEGRIADTNNKYFDNYLQYQVNERKQPGNLAMADIYNVGAVDARDVAYEPGQRSLNKNIHRTNNELAYASNRAALRQANSMFGYGGGGGGGVATAPTSTAVDRQATYNYPGVNAGNQGSLFSWGDNSQPQGQPVQTTEQVQNQQGQAPSIVQISNQQPHQSNAAQEYVSQVTGGRTPYTPQLPVTHRTSAMPSKVETDVVPPSTFEYIFNIDNARGRLDKFNEAHRKLMDDQKEWIIAQNTNPYKDFPQAQLYPEPLPQEEPAGVPPKGPIKLTISKAPPETQEEYEEGMRRIKEAFQEKFGLPPELSYLEEEDGLYDSIPDGQLLMMAQSGNLAPGLYQFEAPNQLGQGIQVDTDGSFFIV